MKPSGDPFFGFEDKWVPKKKQPSLMATLVGDWPRKIFKKKVKSK